MNQNKRFDITWKKVHKSTFMYGSKLKFNNNFVSLDNSLMPSGMVIHEWNMLSSYTTNKQVPSLPLLKKGSNYKIKFDYDVIPEKSVYFKIVLYKKNGEKIKTMIIEDDDSEFEYPKDAYSYKIELMNAGFQHLQFYRIIIEDQHIEKCHSTIPTDISETIDKIRHNIV
ncbi:accessory Sec system protein Asp3 [Staphylococcus epidermidis]|mgnify:FL=1|uniref:accessory Sec system protein Asp3 n=1 Tax=Staphylococcus epidermidis TaxID=1282 RepID=UPI002904CEB3|nr:accessory Sec system protein Asp3 [Staphylococcus epidermidis]MDU0428175.1 accessory Sec system protein Asp3 [Staphylococcus epidermidis]MDU0433035.1 accessory Sec system protein Asp3 [Staphylococcus epidermidis]MDU0447423.1 accessory Sec system protein Asp3 [Staphylococcus epidermidis]MDU0456346.1 accessory Sec system protein Asp3 [Staphylococcus epidermidis]MDU0469987.1 accessory Sec system protein Asp3 [Staphylococcus epidermidis]